MKYMPILRVKQSEYLSLSDLEPAVADEVVPMLYQTPAEDGPEWDIVQRRLRLCAGKWQRPAFYDPSLAVDVDGLDPKALYDEALDLGGYAPCTPIDEARADAASNAARQVGAAAIRLSDPFAVLDGNLPNQLEGCVRALGLSKDDVTVVFDLGDAVDERAANALAALPYLDDWGRVVLAGGAFAHGEGPQRSELPRTNLTAWRGADARVAREVTFGDYGTLEAAYVPAVAFAPAAKLTYTEPGQWFYARERSIRTDGNEQMIQIARDVMNRRYWRGSTYSWGDSWIADVERGHQNPGNAAMWIRVALTHHITHVVREDV